MRINRTVFNRLRRIGRGQTGAEQGRGEMYYWLLGYLRGERLVDGPYTSAVEAQSVARQKMDAGRWRVIPLRTRDPQRAKSMMRHLLVTSQHVPLDNAMQNMYRPPEIRSID